MLGCHLGVNLNWRWTELSMHLTVRGVRLHPHPHFSIIRCHMGCTPVGWGYLHVPWRSSVMWLKFDGGKVQIISVNVWYLMRGASNPIPCTHGGWTILRASCPMKSLGLGSLMVHLWYHLMFVHLNVPSREHKTFCVGDRTVDWGAPAHPITWSHSHYITCSHVVQISLVISHCFSPGASQRCTLFLLIPISDRSNLNFNCFEC